MNENKIPNLLNKIKTTTSAHALETRQVAFKRFSTHLKPIDYDRWSELHWKAQLEDNLNAPEAQELAVLESANMQTIGDVYDALQSDVGVGKWIEGIRGHEWVRVVEE